MPRPILAEELDEIEGVVRVRPGVSSAEIAEALAERIPQRTLQYRLKRLVDDGRLVREGGDKAARYRTPEAGAPGAAPEAEVAAAAAAEAAVTVSREGEDIRANVRRPVGERTPVG